MPTWTCNNFKGHYPAGVGAVITAETIELACSKLEETLIIRGLPQEILPEQLVPFHTKLRYIRILADGDY